MNLEKVNQWLLLVSHLGILGGLVLVAFQIRQDNELARVQLFSDITSSRISMIGNVLGENPAPTLAKALSAPNSLTPEELYVMDAYLIRGLNEVRRSQVLKRVDLDIGVTRAENTLAFYFGNEFAQRWWAGFTSSGEDMNNEVLKEIDQRIRATGVEFTKNVFEGLSGGGAPDAQ